jgi:hypothetical protein
VFWANIGKALADALSQKFPLEPDRIRSNASDYHAIARPLAASAFCQSRWKLEPQSFSGSSKHYPPRALSERLIPLTSLLLHNHLETECI